jgi:hypothetical protein
MLTESCAQTKKCHKGASRWSIALRALRSAPCVEEPTFCTGGNTLDVQARKVRAVDEAACRPRNSVRFETNEKAMALHGQCVDSAKRVGLA